MSQDKAKEVVAPKAVAAVSKMVAACNFEDGKSAFVKGAVVEKPEAHWLAQGLVVSHADFVAQEEVLASKPKSYNVHGSARVHKSK